MTSTFVPPLRSLRIALLISLAALSSGCAALTNPVATGVPVNLVPDELIDQPRREELQTIPLNLLSQPEPAQYRLDHKDVLGIHINGILPSNVSEQVPQNLPVYFPSQVDPLGAGLSPSLGYPIGVTETGHINLPLINPIPVKGLTVEEARAAIIDAYLSSELIQPGKEQIQVTLMSPRQVRVMVIREEVGGFATGGRGDIAAGNGKRGTGHVVYLRAYQNDVLHALSLTGGLPGLDAYAEIVVYRRGVTSFADATMFGHCGLQENLNERTNVRIPTRVHPHAPVAVRPDDVILQDGDVVFLESRNKEVFYTGGLLPSTEQVLPRDRDLDVIEAIGFVQGPLVNGSLAGNNLNGNLVSDGIGNPSPRQLTVIRKTPAGGQIPIEVDLARALRDPRERILVRADDILVLQETPKQAIARWFTQRFDVTSNFALLDRGSALSVLQMVNP